MKHAFSLGLVLSGLWLLLSWRTEPHLLALGLASVLLVAVLVRRMDNLDSAAHPVVLIPCVLRFWAWLARRILITNIDVSRIILSPSLPISPTICRVRAHQSKDVCKVTYANSITLTPGTVAIDMQGDEIVVHALTRKAAEDLKRGEMDRRLCEIEE